MPQSLELADAAAEVAAAAEAAAARVRWCCYRQGGKLGTGQSVMKFFTAVIYKSSK
jgi:hypothetical protein